MTTTTTLYAVVHGAQRALAEAGITSAAADAAELAAFALGVDRAEVQRLMILRQPADPAFVARFDALVAERCARIPLQHLTGRAYFRELTLAVGPGVFVPRPETELAAGLAIDAARRCIDEGVAEPVVIDLCTGSGAIALAVKDEVPTARVRGVELSDLAHGWAVANQASTGLDVELTCGDATTAYAELAGTVDVVVSNPPYIPDGMVPVDPEVRDHDPSVALYGGATDGLAIPLAVARNAARLLRPGGVFVMEHADTQGVSLPEGLRAAGHWLDVLDHKDLNDRPRAVSAVRTSEGPPTGSR